LLCLLLLLLGLLLGALSHGAVPPPLFEQLRPCSAQRSAVAAVAPVIVERRLLLRIWVHDSLRCRTVARRWAGCSQAVRPARPEQAPAASTRAKCEGSEWGGLGTMGIKRGSSLAGCACAAVVAEAGVGVRDVGRCSAASFVGRACCGRKRRRRAIQNRSRTCCPQLR
jgi:hypothetical protein